MVVPRGLLRREPVESRNPPHEDDLERLSELRQQGSRLRLPHPVRAFLCFESERAAREAADLLRREGFTCAVRAGPQGSWAVTAIRRLVPTPGAITRLREQMEALATAHEGSYRGWDAPVVY
jgi:hypothetical protein